MNKAIVTFGEIMMRLNPKGYERFLQADEMEISYAGGEANVAVSLANYGLNARFVTKLPNNDLGQSALNTVRHFGVDTSYIVRSEGRLGLYFVEKGASQRPSKVIYDRKDSVIAKASVNDFNWDAIFDGASWFHFTGITPALGDNVAAICLEACKKAKAKNITVSCDLNFRKKLWTSEKAGKVMAELMEYIDVCIANEEDAEKVFGISAKNTDVTGGKLDKKGYEDVAKQLADRFHLRQVAITLRTSLSASDNKWAALLYDGKNYYYSKEYLIRIVDRVGGGDSFGAGLIYGNVKGFDPQKTVDFAVAASCLKQTIEGDFNHISVGEAEKLMGGDASGRVSR